MYPFVILDSPVRHGSIFEISFCNSGPAASKICPDNPLGSFMDSFVELTIASTQSDLISPNLIDYLVQKG